MLSDEDLSYLLRTTTALMKMDYLLYPEITDSTLNLITSMARLIETNYITFDSEFKTILYEWEYKHHV